MGGIACSPTTRSSRLPWTGFRQTDFLGRQRLNAGVGLHAKQFASFCAPCVSRYSLRWAGALVAGCRRFVSGRPRAQLVGRRLSGARHNVPPRTRIICTLRWAGASPQRLCRWALRLRQARSMSAISRLRRAGVSGRLSTFPIFGWPTRAGWARFALLVRQASLGAPHAVQLCVQPDCRGRALARPAASRGSGLTRRSAPSTTDHR